MPVDKVGEAILWRYGNVYVCVCTVVLSSLVSRFYRRGKERDIKNHITFHDLDTLQAHSMRVFETVLVISKIPD